MTLAEWTRQIVDKTMEGTANQEKIHRIFLFFIWQTRGTVVRCDLPKAGRLA